MLTEKSVWLPQSQFIQDLYLSVVKMTSEMSYMPVSSQASSTHSLLSKKAITGFLCLQHILEYHRGSIIRRDKPNSPESLLRIKTINNRVTCRIASESQRIDSRSVVSNSYPHSVRRF